MVLGLSALIRDRIYRRARSYQWMGRDLFKLLQRVAMVVVPRPAPREEIALDTHKGMGHFSAKWVLDRLQKN